MIVSPSGESRRFIYGHLPPLVLIVAGVLFFSDFLFSSKNFYFRDILNFHYPLRRVLIDSLRRGEFPLWNPFIYLGQPMLANPNYMTFYPTNLLHFFMPFNYAFKLHFLLHPILGGVGLYCLQIRLGIDRRAALGGALVYQLSGTVLSFLNLYNIVPAVGLMPWLGWGFLGALQFGSWSRIILFGALLGLQVVAFEPLMFQCELWLLGALALFYLVEGTDRRRTARSVMVTGTLGAMLGFGFSAVQAIPTLELIPHSARGGGFEFADVSVWSMHPLEFLSLIIPNFFGQHYVIGMARYWGEPFHEGTEAYLVSFFAGSSVVVLALLSAFSHRRRLRWILLFVLGAGIFFALGRYNPLYEWLYQYVPVLRLGRYPSKYFLLGTLALSMMSALGLEQLLKNPPSGRAPSRKGMYITAAAAALLSILFLSLWAYWTRTPLALETMIQSQLTPVEVANKQFPVIVAQLTSSVGTTGVFLLITSLLLVAISRLGASSLRYNLFLVLLVAELVPANFGLTPSMSDADVGFVSEVEQFIGREGPREPFRVVSPAMVRPLPTVQLRTPNRSEAWLSLFNRMSGQPMSGISEGIQYSLDRSVDHLNTHESDALVRATFQMPEAWRIGFMRRLNSPLLLSMGETRFPGLRELATFDTRSDTRLYAYWLDGTIARAYFVPKAEWVGSHDAALRRFVSQDFPYQSTVLLEGEATRQDPSTGPAGTGRVRVAEYASNRVVCEVQADGPGYLVLLDSYYPGWEASLDGAQTEILRANYAFRAVRLPPGSHRVEFLYRPRTFLFGLALFLLTLMIAGLLLWNGRKSGKPAAA